MKQAVKGCRNSDLIFNKCQIILAFIASYFILSFIEYFFFSFFFLWSSFTNIVWVLL